MESWSQTRDGHAVDLLAPDLTRVSIDEVAHSLARIGRFAGHTKPVLPYSVAQHSVLVSMHVDPENALWGLLHDAHEAYLGDIPSPVKAALRELGGGPALDSLDLRLQLAVRRRWGLHGPMPRQVKVADLRARATERRDLLGPEAKAWHLHVDGEPCEPWSDERVLVWHPLYATKRFLMRFHELTERSEGEVAS